MDAQQFTVFVVRSVAAMALAESKGLTAEVKTTFRELVEEAKQSIFEPQDNGEPWTDEAIIAQARRHDQVIGEINTRHGEGQ